MKYQLKETIITQHGVYVAGENVELDSTIAAEWHRLGYIQPATTSTPIQQAVLTPSPRRRKAVKE